MTSILMMCNYQVGRIGPHPSGVLNILCQVFFNTEATDIVTFA